MEAIYFGLIYMEAIGKGHILAQGGKTHPSTWYTEFHVPAGGTAKTKPKAHDWVSVRNGKVWEDTAGDVHVIVFHGNWEILAHPPSTEALKHCM